MTKPEVERVSESDHMLIIRMQSEVLAAQRLQAFVLSHIAATYDLGPDPRVWDVLEDRTIERKTPAT